MLTKNICIWVFLFLYTRLFPAQASKENNKKNPSTINKYIQNCGNTIGNFLEDHSTAIMFLSLMTGTYCADKYFNNSAIMNKYKYVFINVGFLIGLPIYAKNLFQYLVSPNNITSTANNLFQFQKSSDIVINKLLLTNKFEKHVEEYKEHINIASNDTADKELIGKLKLNCVVYGETGSGKTQFVEYIAKNTFSEDTHTVYYKKITPDMILRQHISADIEIIRALQKSIEDLYYNDRCKKEKRVVVILQFDEAESLFKNRSNINYNSQMQEIDTNRTNTFLTMIDFFYAKTEYDVFFMLTTNFFDRIDPAIVRSGRVDNKIYLPKPRTDEKTNYINLYITQQNQNSKVQYTISDENKKKMAEYAKTYECISNMFQKFNRKALIQKYRNNNVNNENICMVDDNCFEDYIKEERNPIHE